MANKVLITTTGVKITIGKYNKPRKAEKTWTTSKYSIFNIGAQAMKIGYRGVRATPDAIV